MHKNKPCSSCGELCWPTRGREDLPHLCHRCAAKGVKRPDRRTPTTVRLCTIEGCNRKHSAKGLCASHYRLQNYSYEYRHPKREYVCDCCGITFQRQDKGDRYAKTYCSVLCTSYDRGYPLACTWPKKSAKQIMVREVKPPRIVDCAWCGTKFTTNSIRNRFCTKACQQKSKRSARRAREYNAPGIYSWAEIARLWVTFDRSCAYCNTPTPLPLIQAEHVVPLSKGGANNLTNLLPSCALCNGDKRDLLLPDWSADRKARGKPAVTTTWDERDARYQHLTSTSTHALIAAA